MVISFSVQIPICVDFLFWTQYIFTSVAFPTSESGIRKFIVPGIIFTELIE